MNSERTFSVRLTTWRKDAARFSPVRFEVFVNEQGVPPEIEADALDAECIHAMAEEASGKVIGTGRLLPSQQNTGRIGRMAVVAQWRGVGVGAALLQALVNAAQRRGDKKVVLHAQTSAEKFYLKHGFVREGEAYEEAGIAHINMHRPL